MKWKDIVGLFRFTLQHDYTFFKRAMGYRFSKRKFKTQNARELHHAGVTVVEEFLDASACARLAAQICDLSGQTPSGTTSEGALVSIRRSNDGKEDYDTNQIEITHVDRSIREAQTLIDSPRVREIIEDACDRSVRSLNCTALINRSVVNPRCFHCDTTGMIQYKAFLYLTDVHEELCGPYAYIKSSHFFSCRKYLNLLKNLIQGYPVTDMRLYDRTREVRYCAPKGTLIISNQNGFHRGIPQAPGKERVVLLNNFVSS